MTKPVVELLKSHRSIRKFTNRDYYLQRTRGKLDKSWSRDMAEKLSNESRPHMKQFLRGQGFKFR